jgi:anti-sigma B factor antagonist
LLRQIPTPAGYGWIEETEDPLLELYHLVGEPSDEVERGATPSVRLALVGDVCVYSAPLVKPDLRRAAPADGLVVLDLSEVSFCDAAGIHLLVSVRNELERRHIGLAIERVSRPVSHLLTMTGAAEQFSRASVLGRRTGPPAMSQHCALEEVQADVLSRWTGGSYDQHHRAGGAGRSHQRAVRDGPSRDEVRQSNTDLANG